jgi:hypothetical protein
LVATNLSAVAVPLTITMGFLDTTRSLKDIS